MDKKFVEERFWAKVNKEGPTPTTCPTLGPCWLWIGCTQRGYGLFSVGIKQVRAHRYAYALLQSEIEGGLTVDHLCRVRHCVNPMHMELVSNKTNVLRGIGRTARQARQTECSRGHPFDLLNTYLNKRGQRACKECQRTWYARHLEAARKRGREYMRQYRASKQD